MWTREKLAAHLASGADVDFLFFWGHTPKRAGAVDASCLSQWFERAFEVDGVRYATAEHFMMASKAKLFGDKEAFARVLRAPSPADAKAIGRTVRDYDDVKWERARFDAVVRGNVAKFSQHEDLRRFLLGTRERFLVAEDLRLRRHHEVLRGRVADAVDLERALEPLAQTGRVDGARALRRVAPEEEEVDACPRSEVFRELLTRPHAETLAS